MHRSERGGFQALARLFCSPNQRAQRQDAAAGRLLPPRQRGVMTDVDARGPASGPCEWVSPPGADCHAPSPRPSCLRPSGLVLPARACQPDANAHSERALPRHCLPQVLPCHGSRHDIPIRFKFLGHSSSSWSRTSNAQRLHHDGHNLTNLLCRGRGLPRVAPRRPSYWSRPC